MADMHIADDSWRATDAFNSRRLELGLSQKRLALAAGTSQSEAWRIEHGLSLPALPICEAFAHALDAPVTALFDPVGQAPLLPARGDLMSIRAASLATGASMSSIGAWLRHGLVSDYGVGGRGRRCSRLVALAEVREQHRAAGWLSQRNAGRLLQISLERLTPEFADRWRIASRRVGEKNLRFEPRSVERAVALRARHRLRFISTAETGLPTWALHQLEADKLLQLYRGDRGELLVLRTHFDQLRERLTERPPTCRECGKPVEIGRHFHRGCAAAVAMRSLLADPDRRAAMRAARSATSRAWWDSADGRARRHAQSATGWPRPRTDRVMLPCFICGGAVPRKVSVATTKRIEKRRTVCVACDRHWRSARMRAQWIVNRLKPNTSLSEQTYEIALQAYAIGMELQEQLLPTWANRRGRRRPIATDLLIEVLHLHGLADDTIERLVSMGIARKAIHIAGVDKDAVALMPGYVRKRRRRLGIIRAEHVPTRSQHPTTGDSSTTKPEEARLAV